MAAIARDKRLSMRWPDNKQFAFTIFDDTDSQTLENGSPVYRFLADCGFRTTKSVWPTRGPRQPSDHGSTCAEPDYLRWVQGLQSQGFEIGYHMAASHTSLREETIAGLERFRQFFGHAPVTMANHYYCDENLYWGEHRLSGSRRLIYNALTRFTNHNRFYGHIPGHPYFWGDLCRGQIKYVRNFVFGDINTLKVCPIMPYHDPERPYVNYWYASSEGANVRHFIERISERNQDQLEAEGGACIMYTHFGLGFYENGALDGRFQELMKRLARKSGWFVPVSTLLDYLMEQNGAFTLDAAARRRLERRWLAHKLRFGGA
jgi:hypothetical protein